jgi:8-oxo-dGTP pyrophosphatase MutT (NUDIX family)
MPVYAADPVWGVRAVVAFGRGFEALGPGERHRLFEGPGEVVLVLSTSDGQYWLHTKGFYPSGTYRLATGGLKEGETPDAAYGRELLEEVGIAPAPMPDRVARIGYCEDAEVAPFVSYLYGVGHVDRPPEPADRDEQITGWRKVPRAGIEDAARLLRELPPDWRSWGVFRAVAHEVLLEALNRRGR